MQDRDLRLSRTVLWLCGSAAVLAALGLLGNIFDLDPLMGVVPGRPRMRLVTALLIALVSVGTWLQRSSQPSAAKLATSRAIGAAVLLQASLIVIEYACDSDFGIDWRLPSVAPPGPHPGRPSPFAALALAALGVALLLRMGKARWVDAVREASCLVAVFIAFTSLIGHAFGAGELYEFRGSHVIGVALPTGIAVTALGIAAWFMQPQVGLLHSATAPGPGGVLLRRLGGFAVAGGPLLGGLFLLFVKVAGLRDLALIVALAVVLGVVCALCLLIITAVPIERSAVQSELDRARAEQLFEQAPLGVFVADLSGRYTDVNTAGCKLLGFTRDEILGKTIVDLIPEHDVPRLWSSRERMLDGSMNLDVWKLRRKDGALVPVEVTAKVLPDGRWQAFVSNIAERLELERSNAEALAEQQFLSRVGVELAACLEFRETLACVTRLATSFLGDLATVDVARNSSALTRDIALGRTNSQNVAEAVAELGSAWAAGHPIATVLETKQPLLLASITSEQRRHYATSPEHLRVLDAVNATSAMVVPLIARGQLLAVLSIAARDGTRTYTDTDLRLAMELARRAALTLDNVQLLHQSRLQAAVTTHLAEAVIVVRAADRSIVYANPRTETMFGFAAHELLGLSMATLHAAAAASGAGEQIAEALERASVWHGELECLGRDGALFWCSVSVSNFDHDQHGRVWIALYTDISERKRALQEKEALLREVHHRVKNNLQVISSLFSLQRERTDSPELRQLLEESRTRVASIALVHDQLYRAADLAAIDFDEYLRNLVQAIRASFAAERISVNVSAHDVLLEIDQAVPCALLLCELVSNSFRHAFDEAPGEVSVRAQRDAEGYYVLEVSDNGRGLPADFDWRKSRSLGLKLVYILARQLRASITVDCSHGACFRLRFPSWHAKAAQLGATSGTKTAVG